MGAVNPNPLVGAVIVKDGQSHRKGLSRKIWRTIMQSGTRLTACTGEQPRARRSVCDAGAMLSLREDSRLVRRPSCAGRDPPSGDRWVVDDPNPLVAGKGHPVSCRKRGITVETGVLKKECDAFKSRYFFITFENKTPVCGYEICNDDWMERLLTAIPARRSGSPGKQRKGKCAAGSAPLSWGSWLGVGTVRADDPHAYAAGCREEEIRCGLSVIRGLRTPLESQRCDHGA